LHAPAGGLLLDVGCNWGRWSFAAAAAGFRAVGIDPQLGAVVAASRVARQMGWGNASFICADARFLPFGENTFDAAFSYSVLQHFSHGNVRLTVDEISRICRPGGKIMVQMPRKLGIRTLYQQIRRGFRPARGFDVRFWSDRELRRAFGSRFAQVESSIDCFFGIGLQAADRDLMPSHLAFLISVSEALRRLAATVPWLKYLADSVYVSAAGKIPIPQRASSTWMR
jgi:SAM-dependent methyltransferase